MIIVLRGPQGSGKSSAPHRVDPSLIVSSDEFRVRLAGTAIDQRVSKQAFGMMNEIVEHRASLGLPTVVDATHTTVKYIKPYADMSKKYGVPLHVIDFQMYDVDSLMEGIRNRARNGGLYVPRVAVERTVEKLQNSQESVKELVSENFFHAVDTEEMAAQVLENTIELHTLFNPVEVSKDFWAIGDIHGCLKTFDALLETLETEKGAKDICLLGDYVDRGPDSVGVLGRIDRLLKSEDINVHAIRGNHDDALYRELKFGKYCRSHARKKTHQEIFTSVPTSTVVSLIEKMPQSLTFFNVDLDKVVVATHAGLEQSGGIPNYRTAASSNSSEALNESEKEFLYTLNKESGIIQVHGHRHWEHKKDIDPVMANLDGGAVYGGELVAYNPFTREVVRQPLIDDVKQPETINNREDGEDND